MRAISYLSSPEGQRTLLEPSLLVKRLLLKLKRKDPPLPLLKACVCGVIPQSPELICKICSLNYHIACMGKAACMSSFECPLCQLTQVEPYEPVTDTLLPPSQSSLDLSGTLNPKRFLFTADHQLKLLQKDRKFLLQIRCIRLDEQCYTYHWPRDCSVVLNGKTLISFAQPACTSSKKRKDYAVQLPELNVGENQVMVIRQREEMGYAFGVFIVEVLPAEEVARRICVGEISTEEGRNSILSKALGSDDIVTQSFKQSLKCPLTRLLPLTPVRGLHCSHIQCFDLLPYVVMQEKARASRWKCPICNQQVLKMVVDLYMKELITKAKEQSAEMVEFGPNGQVTFIAEPNDSEGDSDIENFSVPIKRPKPVLSDIPVKKAEISFGPQLTWSDFYPRKGNSGLVSPTHIQQTLPYRGALKAGIVKKGKQLRPVQGSADCPILLDD